MGRFKKTPNFLRVLEVPKKNTQVEDIKPCVECKHFIAINLFCSYLDGACINNRKFNDKNELLKCNSFEFKQ